MPTLPIIEARKQLTTLADQLSALPELGAVTVTRRGKPVLAILSWDLYEAITESLEILGDPEQMRALREGIEELHQGKEIAWEEAKKQLLAE